MLRKPRFLVVLAPLTLAVVPACDDVKDALGLTEEDAPPPAPASAPAADDAGEAEDAGKPPKADDTGPKPAEPAAEAPGDATTDSAGADASADGGDAEAAAPLLDIAPGGPGPAYFVVDKKGIVMLDGGTFELLPGSPDTLLKHWTRQGDRLFLLAYKEIVEVKGKRLDTIAEAEDMPSDFAVTADGHVWTVDYDGVHYFDGGKWTDTPKADLGAEVKLLNGVGVDRTGQVWVTSSNEIHLKTADGWKSIDTKPISKRSLFLDSIEAAPTGVLYAWTGSEIIELGPGEAIKKAELGLTGFLQIDSVTFSNSGKVAFRTGLQEVGRHDGKLKKWSAKKKHFTAKHVGAVTVDDQGRVWVASKVGVSVLGPDDQVVEWPSGAVPEISGEIESMVVIGAGPELPEAGPVKTGGIRGKLLRDGAGLAGFTVELCPSPSMMFSKTPCAESPVKFSTKTDETGTYTFENVPLGAYGVAVKAEDGWRLSMGSNIGAKMKEGKVYDAGSMEIEKKDGK
jgi:sugar lactone lactonase YvrE